MDKPELSLVIPLYNEQGNLEPLAQSIEAVLASSDNTYEAVFVDDASEDGSGEELKALAAKRPWVRVLTLAANCGQSSAMEAGFRAARADIVVTMDADMQNDPADIPRLLAVMRENAADVVCGIRLDRQDSRWRRFSSRFANAVRRVITRDHFRDVGCSLKVIRRDYLVRMKMFSGMHRFLPILLELEGAKVIEVPVSHRPRLSGKSKYTARNRVWRALADAFAVRWMKKRMRLYRIVKED